MAQSYKLDTNQSQLNVHVSAEGVLSSFGHNPDFAVRDFTGELEFDPDAPEKASLSIKINSDSLELSNQDIGEDDREDIQKRMREEVLEVADFPEITFKSKEISASKVTDNWYRIEMTGDLTLHGVTNTETIDTQIKIRGDSLNAEGEFKLKQNDYNIKRVSALGGALKVKDEVKFSFNFAAKKV